MTMRRGASLALLALLGGLAAQAAQAQAVPLRQAYGDWTVACDNIRSCAAQGYQVKDETGVQAGLWLSRAPGPLGVLQAQLHLSAPDGQELPEGTRAGLRIGRRTFSQLPLHTDLQPATVQALVDAMVEAPTMQMLAQGSRATVSLQGLKAALLKMDAVQGRVGTVTAWVAKGRAPAGSVPPAPPMPALWPAAPPPPADAAQNQPLMQQLRQHPEVVRDCSLLQEESGPAGDRPDGTLYRIRAGEYLLLLECDRAAYQSSFRLWRVRLQPRLAVAPEHLPDIGEPALDLMNADFSEGTLSTWHKGRGLSDCGSSRRWVWTATGFALLMANDAPDCNGLDGGGPGLSLWHAELEHPKP